MRSTRAQSLHRRSTAAYEQLSLLYELLNRYVLPTYREGPALSSLEALCDLYLQLQPEAKSRAGAKIAQAWGLELWLGFYFPEVDSDVDCLAVEIRRHKSLGECGLRQERMALYGASELLASTPEQLGWALGFFGA